MMIKIRHVSDSTLIGCQYIKPHQRSQSLLQNPPKNLAIFIPKEKQGFESLSSYKRFEKYGNNSKKYIVHSAGPGASPSGPTPNIISWIMAVSIAIVIPFINHKWGPLLKKKVEGAMQKTEDVAEAVEKVAEEVAKVAEDITDELPAGGKLKKAIDFVENLAERTAKDAGAVDDFIDKVQEEEEKAKSFVDSLEGESKKPSNDSNSENPNH